MAKESVPLYEKLSPIKFSLFELTVPDHNSEEKENMDLKAAEELFEDNESRAKIYPHGLLAKHEIRRNTIHHISSLDTPAKENRRSALTSPRFAIPAFFPPNTVDSIIASPSYRVRSKRIKNGENLDIDRYLKGIGKGPSRSGEAGDDLDHTSPLKKKRTVERETTLLVPETDVIGNDTLLPSQIGLHSDAQFSFEPSSNGPTSADGVATNDHHMNVDNDSKKVPNDLLRVEDTDLTIDLLNPPNLKPIFTSRYISSIEQKYRDELRNLETIVADKNSHIDNLLTRVHEQEQSLMNSKHALEVKRRENFGLDTTNKNLNVQLKQLTTDFSRAITKLKHKDSLLYQKNQNLDLTTKKLEEYIVKANQIPAMQRLLESSNNNLETTQRLLSSAESEVVELKRLLESEQAGRVNFKEELEALRDERDSLQLELKLLTSTNADLLSRSEQLEEDIKRSEGIKENLNAKFDHLVKEMGKLQEDMAMFETQHKEMEAQLMDKDSELKQYQCELESLKKVNERLQHSLTATENLATNYDSLEIERNKLLDRIRMLELQNEEKDRIISGDTKKLSQLVEELSNQKQILSDLKASNKEAVGHDDDLLQQITTLKRQVSNAQQKTDERIQEVAEQLFHQYSKKHELKVNQLKEKYEAKLEDKNRQINFKERQIESMESRVKTAEKEKNYLFLLLEKSEKSEGVRARGGI